MDETIPMQVKWIESIPAGSEGLGHVHTNRQYYPDMLVKRLVGNRASYRSSAFGCPGGRGYSGYWPYIYTDHIYILAFRRENL